jgi:hypothetical protein
VDAWFLRTLFDSVYVLALAVWVGSVAFFTFGAVPVVLRVLGADAGGRLVRALCPRYYVWGTVCGAVALPAAVGVPLSFPEYRAPAVGIQALAILAGTLIMLYAGNSLTPAIDAAVKAGPAAEVRVARLRRRALVLNGVALAIGAGLLVAFANRPAPRSTGIVEPSPRERARLEAEAWRAKHQRKPEGPPNPRLR